MTRVEKVGIEAIPAIRKIALSTWPVTYKDILTPSQMSYMLDLIYSESSLQKQMLEKSHNFILSYDNDLVTGFSSYSIKDNSTPAIYKLQKIYIDNQLQGKGVGKLLLKYVIEEVKQVGATALHLNVNRHNKALQFYEKMGFTKIGEEDIDIGNGYFMNDYILSLPL